MCGLEVISEIKCNPLRGHNESAEFLVSCIRQNFSLKKKYEYPLFEDIKEIRKLLIITNSVRDLLFQGLRVKLRYLGIATPPF